jgi:hypothetical protein
VETLFDVSRMMQGLVFVWPLRPVEKNVRQNITKSPTEETNLWQMVETRQKQRRKRSFALTGENSRDVAVKSGGQRR